MLRLYMGAHVRSLGRVVATGDEFVPEDNRAVRQTPSRIPARKSTARP
jgi:hypothetical protein